MAHGCCKIDEHRMIIVGGHGHYAIPMSSGYIYAARIEQSTPLPNDMPEAQYDPCAVRNKDYMYVIGGRGTDADDSRPRNSLYRLSLVTYEWTVMASPMRTGRKGCAGILLGDYLYIFGGANGTYLASAERYSLVGNIWEDLPDMAAPRHWHCAVAALRKDIYILGGNGAGILEGFDTELLEWRIGVSLCDMPESRFSAAAVVLKDRYLVVIGGHCDERDDETAGCLIYDCLINRWSSTPAHLNMITARCGHSAALLDGKIVVAGGFCDGECISSMECIDAGDIFEYAPLDYPLPTQIFNRILELGKPHDDAGAA